MSDAVDIFCLVLYRGFQKTDLLRYPGELLLILIRNEKGDDDDDDETTFLVRGGLGVGGEKAHLLDTLEIRTLALKRYRSL